MGPAAPGYAPQPTYDEPAVYAYQYGVADDYSGAQFGQDEKRDGYSTSGSYRVALPDGRTQVVNYNVADAYSGYVADVSYEGVPHYGPAPVHAKHALVHAPVVAHAKPTKPKLPNQTYQTKPTKPNLPNQTYQIKTTKPNLPTQTYQTKPTKPDQTRPDQTYFL